MTSITRRQALVGGSAVGLVAAGGGFAVGTATGWGSSAEAGKPPEGGAAGSELAARAFVTRPDLRPPAVQVNKLASGTDPGYVFVSPVPGMAVRKLPEGLQAGPLIIDNQGEPVWFGPTSAMRLGELKDLGADFRVQQYKGQQVLTHWRGDMVVPPGFGHGEYVLLDSAYQEIQVVRPGNGLKGDLHEFLITKDDTALLTAYRKVDHPSGPVYEGVVQEVDIASGEVLFEWHSLDHVGLEESLEARPKDPKTPYPYFHINSVEPDGDALLISARHTSTVYRIDKATGKVLWRLGGKHSDFRMLPGTYFKRQHDARRISNGKVSVFDNGMGLPSTHSRAIVMELDENAKTAKLVREHVRPLGATSASQGNAQFTSSGHALVGWGSEPYVTEFNASGNVLFDAWIGGELDSYRSYRMKWVGQPGDRPVAAAHPDDDGKMTVYASWNGATEVATWRVLAGSETASLRPVKSTPRAGFETDTKVEAQSYAAVEALDADGKVLGTSEPVPSSA